MGGLGSGPSLKMGGFQSGHSRDKHGILELKIKKRIFFKTRVFSICQGQKSGTKNCIFLKRGSFGAAQVEKAESLGAAKAEKWGAFARHIPVLSFYGSTPLGPTPLGKNIDRCITCQFPEQSLVKLKFDAKI